MRDDSWETLLPPLFAAAGVSAGRGFTIEPLTGGVSSDIVRVRILDGREFCAKRALSRLKVASDWQAPLERNHYEVAWLRTAGEIVPGRVPRVLGEDREHGIALLEYLPAQEYRLWKTELLEGRADPRVATAVAETLGQIHAQTLDSPHLARAFATDHLIEALRFDPYLRHSAARHPALEARILEVLATTAATRMALVHGDVSPKNILIERRSGRPVLLDAECAWYGDPAFDAAFCLNHLVLKAVHMPALGAVLLDQAANFFEVWQRSFPIPLRTGIATRTAALLPCLMLARVDGKSPVDYLGADAQTEVRTMATALIAARPDSVTAVLDAVGGRRIGMGD